ncbi:MAG: 50S ribosomal protein L19 [Candidatus Algichlamydia australiensis]|nr:50S ribosomal protein L19 [Chlamydiales bacterium]
MKNAILEEIEKEQMKKEVPEFNVGDTLKVHTRIIEGNKERIQAFTGIVIARKGGGVSETFSLYRVAYGRSMERTFPLHSPRISEIEIMRRGKVRRAKLHYLRGKSGKKARVKEMIGGKKVAREIAPEPKTEAPKEEPKSEE